MTLNWSWLDEPRAEEAHATIDVVENEAAKVARERLRADPQRHEIVVRAKIGQLHFEEPLLEGPSIAGASSA